MVLTPKIWRRVQDNINLNLKKKTLYYSSEPISLNSKGHSFDWNGSRHPKNQSIKFLKDQ